MHEPSTQSAPPPPTRWSCRMVTTETTKTGSLDYEAAEEVRSPPPAQAVDGEKSSAEARRGATDAADGGEGGGAASLDTGDISPGLKALRRSAARRRSRRRVGDDVEFPLTGVVAVVVVVE